MCHGACFCLHKASRYLACTTPTVLSPIFLKLWRCVCFCHGHFSHYQLWNFSKLNAKIAMVNLKRGKQAVRGVGSEGGPGELPLKFFKIYVSENAFQAILKPFLPYYITSILSKVRHSNLRGGGGGGWGKRILWYFHTYVDSAIFGGYKILNFNIFWGFQKNEYSFGYEDFVDVFWGHHKIGLYLGVISMHFSVFS